MAATAHLARKPLPARSIAALAMILTVTCPACGKASPVETGNPEGNAAADLLDLLATPAGGESGLIDERGAIEVGRGGFLVEPFVLDGGPLVGWGRSATQSLRDGHLPIPSDWRLRVTGVAERDRLVARYAVTNDGAEARALSLVLSARPFQVNPPQQFLNIRGGVSSIAGLLCRADARRDSMPPA